VVDDTRNPLLLPAHPGAGTDEAACGGVIGGLTDEEVAVLARMRNLREEAEALRASLGGTETGGATSGEQRATLEAGLVGLREQWRRLALERDAARHRRMVLLGHEAPEEDTRDP